MTIYDFKLVSSLIESEHYLFKLIANEFGVVFLLHTTEHRDAGRANIKYADNYAGNALAAMVKPGVIEFRYHKEFSDDRAKAVARSIIDHPTLSFALNFTVTYQNRTLITGNYAP